MKTKLLICLLTIAAFFAVSLFNQTADAQTSLVGFVETTTGDGFGCYFVPPADINKRSDKRRYLFLSKDYTDGLMNIGGSDLKLVSENSYQIKSLNGKKRFVWIYTGGDAKVTFNLTQTKTSNEGENVHFDAIIKVQKGSRTQSLQARGFCGG